MKAKKLIDSLGGPQSVANLLNQLGPIFHTRQRVFNWYKQDKIPAWAQIEYSKFLAKAENLANKSEKTSPASLR